MSRSNRQLVQLLQMLVRGVQTGKIKIRWIVMVAVLGIGYLLLQPVLERSLGIDLPGLDDVATNPSAQSSTDTQTADAEGWTVEPPLGEQASGDTTAVENIDVQLLREIVAGQSKRVFTSPAGLRYTRGSLQGHRLKHLMAHAEDNPERHGQHGVFDAREPVIVVALVDEAYLQAQTGRDTRTQDEGERVVYDVNLRRRIGYIGGQSGNRRNKPTAKHVRLVVQGDRLITAFPVIP